MSETLVSVAQVQLPGDRAAGLGHGGDPLQRQADRSRVAAALHRLVSQPTMSSTSSAWNASSPPAPLLCAAASRGMGTLYAPRRARHQPPSAATGRVAAGTRRHPPVACSAAAPGQRALEVADQAARSRRRCPPWRAASPMRPTLALFDSTEPEINSIAVATSCRRRRPAGRASAAYRSTGRWSGCWRRGSAPGWRCYCRRSAGAALTLPVADWYRAHRARRQRHDAGDRAADVGGRGRRCVRRVQAPRRPPPRNQAPARLARAARSPPLSASRLAFGDVL